MPSPSEDELDGWMARLARGDRSAFRPLFAPLRSRALQLARRTLPEDQAMDAAQAILTKVFARASDFEPGRALLPWFYAIASNELRTIERRRRTERARSESATALDAMSSATRNPEDATIDAELRASLDRAIAMLDGPSAQAIAELMSQEAPAVPRSTFRKRLSRAIARLRLLLKETDAGEP